MTDRADWSFDRMTMESAPDVDADRLIDAKRYHMIVKGKHAFLHLPEGSQIATVTVRNHTFILEGDSETFIRSGNDTQDMLTAYHIAEKLA